MPYPAISPLPAVPQRASGDPDFSNQVDTFLNALPDFVTEANTAGDWVETMESAIEGHKTAAEAAQTGAEAAVTNAEALATLQNYRGPWDAGTTYAQGEAVTHLGAFWYSNIANNLNNAPPGGSGQWEIFYARPAAGLWSLKTNTASITSTTWGSTGLSIANLNVPSAANNVVLLTAMLNVAAPPSGVWFRILRNGGPILTGAAAGSRSPVTAVSAWSDSSAAWSAPVALIAIDDNPQSGFNTYEIQWRCRDAGATAYLNRSLGDIDNATYPRAMSFFRATVLLV